MDPDTFNDFLKLEVKRVLPHLEEEVIESVVDFLITKGCKKQRDLRIMTIPILETKLDLVDATELYVEWQNNYGVDLPSTSSGSHGQEAPSTSRRVLSDRQLHQEVERENSKNLKFYEDSPYMPARVKNAILNQQRPTAKDREDMVARIVDRCREIVQNLERCDFNDVADHLVSPYPASFKDTLVVSKLGSDSLRSQLKNKFDNDKRPLKLFAKEKECPNIPAAYGCTSWNPSIPEQESEARG